MDLKKIFANTHSSDQDLYEKALAELYPDDAEVAIEVSAQQLKENFKYGNIPCRATFNSISQECVVACGHFSKLRSSLDSKSENVNLLDYIPQLIPKFKRQIGLVTYQNGILNTVEEFQTKGKLIQSFFPEGTLCIGLYNPMVDPVNSFINVCGYHFLNQKPASFELRLLFKAIVERITSSVPSPIWVHIAHSEGGGNAYSAIHRLSLPEKQRLKKHLIILGYGSILPAPKDMAMLVYNTYSDGDNAAFRFSKPRPKDDYHIEIVPSKDSSKNNGIAGDHAFEGKTYQAALKDNIDRIKELIEKKDGILDEQKSY